MPEENDSFICRHDYIRRNVQYNLGKYLTAGIGLVILGFVIIFGLSILLIYPGVFEFAIFTIILGGLVTFIMVLCQSSLKKCEQKSE